MPTVKLTSDELSLVLAARDQFTDQQAELCDNLEKKLCEAKKFAPRPPGGIWAPRIGCQIAG